MFGSNCFGSGCWKHQSGRVLERHPRRGVDQKRQVRRRTGTGSKAFFGSTGRSEKMVLCENQMNKYVVMSWCVMMCHEFMSWYYIISYQRWYWYSNVMNWIKLTMQGFVFQLCRKPRMEMLWVSESRDFFEVLPDSQVSSFLFAVAKWPTMVFQVVFDASYLKCLSWLWVVALSFPAPLRGKLRKFFWRGRRRLSRVGRFPVVCHWWVTINPYSLSMIKNVSERLSVHWSRKLQIGTLRWFSRLRPAVIPKPRSSPVWCT